VQYLAEVQKQQKGGFNISGKGKAELKLLACQRTEQNWSAIPGEELVVAPDEANNFNHGVLVLVDMNANRQIQSGLKDAAKHLVGILQNLSRQIEKYKKEADEIESWRQSLSLQSQQLQMRQEEIYAREEELETTRSELDRLTQESQAIQATIDEHEQQRQELESGWTELKAQQEAMAQAAGGGAVVGVSEQQVAEIRAALDHIGTGGSVAPEELTATLSSIEFQQELLNQHWERLRQQKQRNGEVEFQLQQQQQELEAAKNDLQDLENTLDRAKTDWEVQQRSIDERTESSHRLSARIQLEQENYQRIATISQGLTGDSEVNLEQLESMPVGELETIVANLHKDVERAVSFVNLQEEELAERQSGIEEIQAQIAGANEFDKIKLEADLSDERDGYSMLERTLEGQRETLGEKQSVLKLHNRILRQRQGHPPTETEKSQVEWAAVLKVLTDQRQHQQTELDELNTSLDTMRSTLEQSKAKIEQQVNEYIGKSNDIKQLEQQVTANRQLRTELTAKIELYQEMIQPLQNQIDTIKEHFARIGNHPGSGTDSSQARQHLESLLDHLVTHSNN
jgi:chromosome segregation ATPase